MKECQVTSITLLAYSMGGRLVLTLLELMPENIHGVVLLAPDGLKFNYFYFFLTQTSTGRFFFRHFIKQGDWYLKKLALLKRVGIITKSRYKFLQQHLESHELRQVLEKRWQVTRELVPEILKIKENIVRYQIPVHIVMGEYDQIIPVANAHRFSRGMQSVQVHLIKKGHALFTDAAVQSLISQLLLNV